MRGANGFRETLSDMTYSWPLTVKEVGGVPVMPPAIAARGAPRLGRVFGRAHDEMALPFQLLLERLLGVLDAPAVHVRRVGCARS